MSGTFKRDFMDWGKERGVGTPGIEEHILDHVDRDAGVRMRQMGEELNASYMTIWRVLHEHFLCSYRL
jgi:hypothetical protein